MAKGENGATGVVMPRTPPDRSGPASRPPAFSAATRETLTNSIGMKLTLIPAGEFLMGSPNSDSKADSGETPQHRVRITEPFYLGVYEVTQAEFQKVVALVRSAAS